MKSGHILFRLGHRGPSPYRRRAHAYTDTHIYKLKCPFAVFFEKKTKQGNGGDIRKIHVTQQFFEARGPQGHFFEKTCFWSNDFVMKIKNNLKKTQNFLGNVRVFFRAK